MNDDDDDDVFRKTFDTIWRVDLWKKLLKSKVGDKCFSILKNMYENIKSCVEYKNHQSDFFPC